MSGIAIDVETPADRPPTFCRQCGTALGLKLTSVRHGYSAFTGEENPRTESRTLECPRDRWHDNWYLSSKRVYDDESFGKSEVKEYWIRPLSFPIGSDDVETDLPEPVLVEPPDCACQGRLLKAHEHTANWCSVLPTFLINAFRANRPLTGEEMERLDKFPDLWGWV